MCWSTSARIEGVLASPASWRQPPPHDRPSLPARDHLRRSAPRSSSSSCWRPSCACFRRERRPRLLRLPARGSRPAAGSARPPPTLQPACRQGCPRARRGTRMVGGGAARAGVSSARAHTATRASSTCPRSTRSCSSRWCRCRCRAATASRSARSRCTPKRPASSPSPRSSFLASSGALVAGAVENARLYEEARWRVAELEHLVELSEAAASAATLEELLPVVAERTRGLLGASACLVYLAGSGDDLSLAQPRRRTRVANARPVISMSELGPELARSGPPLDARRAAGGERRHARRPDDRRQRCRSTSARAAANQIAVRDQEDRGDRASCSRRTRSATSLRRCPAAHRRRRRARAPSAWAATSIARTSC